ncbi:hypothetical protein QO000_003365 [Alkalihalobacillus hemicentroti]|uniref:Uncharacterized protein n=1 Tax=Guptibacillus hwajinpoensis TaxID=208199 RepID=A0ABU0K4U9_9BACL|nr:hypothetical protein [Alkalihalobacillus hemicentroti]
MELMQVVKYSFTIVTIIILIIFYYRMAKK